MSICLDVRGLMSCMMVSCVVDSREPGERDRARHDRRIRVNVRGSMSSIMLRNSAVGSRECSAGQCVRHESKVIGAANDGKARNRCCLLATNWRSLIGNCVVERRECSAGKAASLDSHSTVNCGSRVRVMHKSEVNRTRTANGREVSTSRLLVATTWWKSCDGMSRLLKSGSRGLVRGDDIGANSGDSST